MRIGVIGAGFVGRVVAKLGVAAGHQAMASNSRGPRPLSGIPGGIGCEVGTAEEAAASGGVAVAAVSLGHYRAVPVEPLAGKLVVDANNDHPQRDGQVAELDAHEATTSELLARHLPSSRVVNQFGYAALDAGLPAGEGWQS